MTERSIIARRCAQSILVLVLLIGTGDFCMAVERPKYAVELSDPPYEIRDYAPTIVAVVHVEGDRNEAVNAGFRILAKYIFGDNQARGKIAMTAPVTQASSQTIAMTAPVQRSAARSGWEVRFTMPATYTLSKLPIPTDDRVHLVEIPRHRVAAVKFSGFWSDSNLQSHAAQLVQWVKARKLTPTATPSYAYYDPPWTPWFLRTIEVLVDIAPVDAQRPTTNR
jgi:DNA gyrase inhibitor GyrI